MNINIGLIGNFIETNKLSKTKFCKLCKISYGTMQKIFLNKYNFKINSLFKIARIMKIEVCKLFTN